MQAMKNAVNLGVLGLWATMGLLLTLSTLSVAAFGPVLGFWLWFAGYAAVMSWVVSQVKAPLAALGLHGAGYVALHFVPKVFPLHVLRLGLDLLASR